MRRVLSALVIGGTRHVSRHQGHVQKTTQRLIHVVSNSRCSSVQKQHKATSIPSNIKSISSKSLKPVDSTQGLSASVFDDGWDDESDDDDFEVTDSNPQELEENEKHLPKRGDLPNPTLLQEGDKFYPQFQAYTSHFLPLLKEEQQEEANRVFERLSTWPVGRLRTEGYTLTGLTANEYRKKGEKFHDGYTFSFKPPPGEELEPNTLTRGVHVTVVPNDKSPLDYNEDYPVDFKNQLGPKIALPKAVVLYSSSDEVRVRFMENKLKFPYNMQWRLDFSSSNTAYTRTLEAISNLKYDPEAAEEASSVDQQYALRGTYLRNELLGGWPVASECPAPSHDSESDAAPSLLCTSEPIQNWVDRYSSPIPKVEKGDPQLDLNTSQIMAIAIMLKERLSLIQGPPGTGKTKTIIETIRLLKAHFKVPYPILLCTYTNVAVDNLVEGIVQAGLNPLRVGNQGGVRENLEQWSLQTKLEKHSSWPDILKLKETCDDRKVALNKCRKANQGDQASKQAPKIKEEISILKRRITQLRRKMQYEIYSGADVVCTTCLTAGAPSFQVIDFPIIFLDEASMSTEPASLIPLMHGLALIGDHKQLPPIITSTVARDGGLSRSLFERLIDEKKYPTIMLDTQYRMHPGISAFPSKHFYDTALKDGTVLPSGRVSKLLSPPRSSHLSRRLSQETGELPSMLFIHHDNHEMVRDRSKANTEEMRIVVAIIEDLLLSNPEMTGNNIGVISPYVAQTRLLNAILRGDAGWAESFEECLGYERAAEVGRIEVKTVDGFEGREKDVIIFSTVRNNRFGQIGFLADRRRMNVALTRAKRALFVLGSLSTLSKGRYGDNVDENGDGMEYDVAKLIYGQSDEWQKYVQFVLANQLFVEFDHPVEYRSAEEVAEFERSYQAGPR